MTNNDETVKLIADTLKRGMKKFVGERADENTLATMKTHMVDVLTTFGRIADLPAPLPQIDVTINGCEATFSFRDPKTNENISLDQWMSRANEGYYV
jgi:hypothetical protein